VKLLTTDTQLHALEQIEDKAREGTDMVRVPRDALRNLLRDHIALNSEVLRKHGALPETTP
jgi:hypothetical protein